MVCLNFNLRTSNTTQWQLQHSYEYLRCVIWFSTLWCRLEVCMSRYYMSGKAADLTLMCMLCLIFWHRYSISLGLSIFQNGIREYAVLSYRDTALKSYAEHTAVPATWSIIFEIGIWSQVLFHLSIAIVHDAKPFPEFNLINVPCPIIHEIRWTWIIEL